MVVDLRSPIPIEHLRFVHFFNGRLVSGEDLTSEQNAQRAAHELLGAAIGDGIVQGLEVAATDAGSSLRTPVLTVGAGLALNRRGEVLVLPRETDVRLVRAGPGGSTIAAVEAFHACTPPQESPPLLDDAVYLLTMCSSRSGEGTTALEGFGNLPRGCSMRSIVDAVEFRLVELDIAADLRTHPQRLRNGVAYACFGTATRRAFSRDPFTAPRAPATLLDSLRPLQLTDCDVPLALLQWRSEGVQFVDPWSVRRRCASGSGAAGEIAFSPRAAAQAEAIHRQFADHLDEVRRSTGNPQAVEARAHFRYLPPAGFLPVSSGAVQRFDYRTFFAGKTCSRPRYIEAADVEAVLRESVHYPPIDLDDEEMIWIYLVHENRQRAAPVAATALFETPIAVAASAVAAVARQAAITSGMQAVGAMPAAVAATPGRPNLAELPFDDAPQFVLFANANLPFFGNSRFDRSHLDFANFV